MYHGLSPTGLELPEPTNENILVLYGQSIGSAQYTNFSTSPSALAVDFNALLMVPFVSDQFIELGNKWHHQQKGNEAVNAIYNQFLCIAKCSGGCFQCTVDGVLPFGSIH